MPLTYDTTSIDYFNENQDELLKEYSELGEKFYDLNPETKSLVFSTMMVHLGEITPSNCADFYARWKIVEKFDSINLYSIYTEDGIVNKSLTPDILIKHIGLCTNVTSISKTKWINQMYKGYKRDKKIDAPSEKELSNLYKKFEEEFSNSITKTER